MPSMDLIEIREKIGNKMKKTVEAWVAMRIEKSI
jgi:hypothetical protein